MRRSRPCSNVSLAPTFQPAIFFSIVNSSSAIPVAQHHGREFNIPSGLSTVNKYQIAERGARMTRRVDREYREYLREAQRSQPGWPAREVVLDQRGQATRRG